MKSIKVLRRLSALLSFVDFVEKKLRWTFDPERVCVCSLLPAAALTSLRGSQGRVFDSLSVFVPLSSITSKLIRLKTSDGLKVPCGVQRVKLFPVWLQDVRGPNTPGPARHRVSVTFTGMIEGSIDK